MQVITTKILLPTDTKGQRIKATCAAGSRTLGWEYGVGVEANHHTAARALCDKLGWNYHFVSGQDVKGDYQHVLLHANMAAPDTSGSMPFKYRSREVERVRTAMQEGDASHGTLKIQYEGRGTRHLNVDSRDVAALLDLFNQVD